MPDRELALTSHLDALEARRLDDGAFAPDAARRLEARPDATAWAILALQAAGQSAEALEPSRSWLAGRQSKGGRVPLTPNDSTVAWPTPLAILAWQGSAGHAPAQKKALAFLLHFRGLAFPRTPLLGHDTTLVGWPWIESTHSWVEPTALGLAALTVTGNASHWRAREARALLLDRRLPEGGWNYGNTTAFGQVQRPTPDSTGVALSALASRAAPAEPEPVEMQDEAVDPAFLEPSLRYLERETEHVRSPLSLAWGLMGLSAWNRRPEAAGAWCLECLGRQATLGPYDTALLAVVLLAAHTPGGLVGSLLGLPPT